MAALAAMLALGGCEVDPATAPREPAEAPTPTPGPRPGAAVDRSLEAGKALDTCFTALWGLEATYDEERKRHLKRWADEEMDEGNQLARIRASVSELDPSTQWVIATCLLVEWDSRDIFRDSENWCLACESASLNHPCKLPPEDPEVVYCVVDNLVTVTEYADACCNGAIDQLSGDHLYELEWIFMSVWEGTMRVWLEEPHLWQ